MASDMDDISFGLDLRQAALCHVDFLQTVDKKTELLDENSQAVQFAIQRYEKLWLPLAAKYCDRFLAAPIDIEWIWHCHLLNPAAYERDCKQVVDKVVDHRVLDRERRKQSLQESCVLWRHEYSSVPFEADGPITPWFDSDFTSQLNYNLIAAVTRQKVFFYQVSLPHYKDEKFLSQAVLRYKKFLHLKRLHPNTFIVPCYDIDLIWHTHMVHPLIYRYDTMKIIGHPFNHDDSVNDRRAGSKLTVSDARTRHMWKKIFDEPFSQSGAMFRGEPPAGKLLCMDASDFTALLTKQTTVLVESARVTGLPEHYQGQYKLKLWYNTGYQNFNRALYVSDSIATVRGSPRHLTNDVRVNANFTFDTKYNDVMMVDLIQKSGRFCLGATAEVGSAQLRMLEKIQALGNGRGITTQDTLDLGDGVGVQLQWSVAPPITGGCILALKSGDYHDCIMPEMVESMWGPVPLPRLPPGVDNHCSVASHSLLNHTKRVIFTVRIIHSLPLMMSAVHVFFKDKLTTVGHLVGADQLPLPQLVKNRDRCVTLDIKNGERAVLLKNHAGDWGVVLGRWTGMRKPVPATETSSGRRGIPGDPGHLEIRFFKFSTKHWRFLSFERDYSGSEHKFQIEAATVELDSGLIEISSEAGIEVAENLALAFSVALLHVLCQPRPKDWDPSAEKAEDSIDGHAAKARPRMAAENLALIMAAGFLALAPSNHLLRKRHREAMEAQAEEEARRKQQEEEQFKEMAGTSGMWNTHHEYFLDDRVDVASGSDVQDVIAIVSAEDISEDIPSVFEGIPSVPENSTVQEDEVDLESFGNSKMERGVCDMTSQNKDILSTNHPHSPTEHAPLHRLPSIAESTEEDVPEYNSGRNTFFAGNVAVKSCTTQDAFNMSTIESSLNSLDNRNILAHIYRRNEPVSKHYNPEHEVGECSGFPLPVEDLPLPSDDLLLPDDTYPLPDEDLPLPDVPDEELPLPIEELPLPDMDSLNQPQAEALQMSAVDDRLNQGCDRAVGFDDNSARGYEKYLNLDTNHLCTNDHISNNAEDTGHLVSTNGSFGAMYQNDSYNDYGENHIPQRDFSHFNGNFDNYHSKENIADYQNDFYLSSEQHLEDMGSDFDLSGRDANGDDHLDIFNGDDVNDIFVNENNYISYEDTSNYDGYFVDDFSCGENGGGGDSERSGGFFGSCGRGDGVVGDTSTFLMFQGGETSYGVADCGEGGAECGEGGGCGGCGG